MKKANLTIFLLILFSTFLQAQMNLRLTTGEVVEAYGIKFKEGFVSFTNVYDYAEIQKMITSNESSAIRVSTQRSKGFEIPFDAIVEAYYEGGTTLYHLCRYDKKGNEKYEFLPVRQLGIIDAYVETICTSHYTPNGSYTTCTDYLYIGKPGSIDVEFLVSTGLKLKAGKERIRDKFLKYINPSDPLYNKVKTKSYVINYPNVYGDVIDYIKENLNNGQNQEQAGKLVMIYKKNKKGFPCEVEIAGKSYRFLQNTATALEVPDSYSVLLQPDNERAEWNMSVFSRNFTKYFEVYISYDLEDREEYCEVSYFKKKKALRALKKIAPELLTLN